MRCGSSGSRPLPKTVLYYAEVRLLRVVHQRLRLLAFPPRTLPQGGMVDPEIFRFPYKELPYMPGSATTPGQTDARDCAPARVAFRTVDGVGTRDNTLSRLNGPTLRLHPRGCLRTARGRCGSLRLHRNGLAPSTPCRSPGAPTVMLACSSLCYDRFISPDKLRPWQTWETLCPFWHRSVLVPELGVHRCDAKNGEL